jgi:hypothetical protein
MIARGARVAVYWFAALLLGFFVMVHVALWDKFPVWYQHRGSWGRWFRWSCWGRGVARSQGVTP